MISVFIALQVRMQPFDWLTAVCRTGTCLLHAMVDSQYMAPLCLHAMADSLHMALVCLHAMADSLHMVPFCLHAMADSLHMAHLVYMQLRTPCTWLLEISL